MQIDAGADPQQTMVCWRHPGEVAQPLRSYARRPTPLRQVAFESIDRFMVLDLIGRGGMGELYLGWDDRLDRKVAIKLVNSRKHSDHAEQRLLREARILGQLSHPNVVSVFEVGRFDGQVYVAMEFVEGVTLRHWLDELDATGVARTRAILACFVAAGRGLAAVHAAGLAHRDFKPDNVLVGPDGRVRIVDFGLARSLHERWEPTDELDDRPQQPSTDLDGELLGTPALTEDGLLLGTPRFMAPEQWQGRRADARSDQFSFCVALYEALFGVRPFEADDFDQLADAVNGGRVRPMPRRREVPPRVREALLRGLSPDPGDRFASMEALLEALLPTPVRRSWVLGAIAVLVLVLASVSMVWWQRGGSQADDDSSFMQLRRELAAAERLTRAELQIEALAEAGAHAQADALFREFAELPDHGGTAALARGWLHQAERLERRGELDEALDAYASAYLSNFADLQQQALFGLARAFGRTRQWQHLRATLASLDAKASASRASVLDERAQAELRAMRVAMHASRRDLLAGARELDAIAASDPDDASLREAMLELNRVRPTEHVLDGSRLVLASLAGIDLDGDDVGELLMADEHTSSLAILGTASAELRELGRLELGPSTSSTAPIVDPVSLTHEGQALVAVRRDDVHTLYRITRGPRSKLHAQPLAEHLQDGHHGASWALADLDDDDALELYLGLRASRRLLAFELPARGHGRWVDPHPSTNAASSVIHGLAAADLDGDGQSELAVLAGEWSAYDLRILGPRPDDEGPSLRLLDRRKLGAVHSLALLPAADGRGRWIAVGVADLYPSQRVFPAEAPGGRPGLHLLRWDGADLELIESWAMPGPVRMFAGDFDGNGLADLALAIRTQEYECSVLLQLRPGEFRSLTLRELWPVGVIDIDDDGDDELLVIETDTVRDKARPRGRLSVLGSGARSLAPLIDPPSSRDSDIARVLRASGADPALRGAITRAEDLAAIGLPLRAAANLVTLARVADERIAAILYGRAAELFAARGHRLEAADLFARALTDPSALAELHERVLARALELYEQVHRFDHAAKLAADGLLEGDTRFALATEYQRLKALADGGPRMVFEFDSPLDERWAIDPLAVRRQHGRLELTLGGAEQGVVARRELDWDGGRFALEVELTVAELEWSSEVRIMLRPLADPNGKALEVGVSSWGGGGIYRLITRCVDQGTPEPAARGWPLALPHAELPFERRRLRISAEYVPGRGVWCTVDGEALHVEASTDGELLPGRYELVIHGSSYPWPRAKASIERISIVGARDPARPDIVVTARDRLGRELAEGRAESVLAELTTAEVEGELEPRARALLQFLALDELGRWDQAELALAQALGHSGAEDLGDCRRDPATALLAGQLLRHRPERLGPTLRSLCRADDYFALLYSAWSSAIHQHPDGAAVERLLTTQITWIERWMPTAPDDRLAALVLLRARARAWTREQAHAAARTQLVWTVELATRWLAEARDDATRMALAAELALARTDLAAELFDRGEEQRAIETLDLALQVSPAPEILVDMLVIDARFASLRERPGWRELIEP